MPLSWVIFFLPFKVIQIWSRRIITSQELRIPFTSVMDNLIIPMSLEVEWISKSIFSFQYCHYDDTEYLQTFDLFFFLNHSLHRIKSKVKCSFCIESHSMLRRWLFVFSLLPTIPINVELLEIPKLLLIRKGIWSSNLVYNFITFIHKEVIVIFFSCKMQKSLKFLHFDSIICLIPSWLQW